MIKAMWVGERIVCRHGDRETQLKVSARYREEFITAAYNKLIVSVDLVNISEERTGYAYVDISQGPELFGGIYEPTPPFP